MVYKNLKISSLEQRNVNLENTLNSYKLNYEGIAINKFR